MNTHCAHGLGRLGFDTNSNRTALAIACATYRFNFQWLEIIPMVVLSGAVSAISARDLRQLQVDEKALRYSRCNCVVGSMHTSSRESAGSAQLTANLSPIVRPELCRAIKARLLFAFARHGLSGLGLGWRFNIDFRANTEQIGGAVLLCARALNASRNLDRDTRMAVIQAIDRGAGSAKQTTSFSLPADGINKGTQHV